MCSHLNKGILSSALAKAEGKEALLGRGSAQVGDTEHPWHLLPCCWLCREAVGLCPQLWIFRYPFVSFFLG